MNQPLSALFLVAATLACATPPHDHAHAPGVLHASRARTVDFPGHAMRVLLEADALPGDLTAFELTVAPRSLAAPPHRHADEDELFYVLEGELVFLSGEDEHVAGPGTAVTLPRGHVHGFWNATDAPARALLMITPARFGRFFDEVVAEIRARHANDPATVGALVGEVAARYGCEVFGDRVAPIVERHGLR